jgi:hypothetical protein
MTISRLFQEWTETHNKVYADTQEYWKRLYIYFENFKYVEDINSQNLSFKLKLNQWADLTPEEFSATFGAQENPRNEFLENFRDQF